MKRTSRILSTLSLATAAVLMAVSLAGCAQQAAPVSSPAAIPGDNSAPAEKITLKFANFSASGDNEQYLKQMIAAFNEQSPNVTIEQQTIAYADYFDQMMAKVSAGQAPDVFELNFENFCSYAKKGVLFGLDDTITNAGFDTSKYNDMALKAFQTDGKQYGVPNSFSNVLLFYNKDLFDKANVAYPTNDWTWKDQLEAAKTIRALDKNTFGMMQPITFNELFKRVKQNGGSLFSDDMKSFTINTKENIETVQYLVDALNKDNVIPTEEQLAGAGDWDLFKSGRLGMILTGVWAIPDFTNNCEFEWDIALEPGNTAKATHFFSNAYVLSKDTMNPDAAFDFVSYLTTGEKPVQIRLDAGWELPPVSDQKVLDAYKAKTPPSNRQAVFDSLSYLVTPPVIEDYQKLQDIVNTHLAKAATGKVTVEAAMNDCQKELTDTIKLS